MYMVNPPKQKQGNSKHDCNHKKESVLTRPNDLFSFSNLHLHISYWALRG